MTQTKEECLAKLPDEQEIRKKRLQRIDISIVFLVAVICGFIYGYYPNHEYDLEKYVLLCIFGAIGMYYASHLITPKHEKLPPAAVAEIKSDISGIVMLNENGVYMKEWNVHGLVALIIGKNTKNKEVEIDLSDSAYDALIHDEHALMNFAGGNWYIEGLHMPSSVSIKKSTDGMRYRLSDNRPCKLDPGDIVYIAHTRLLIK